MRENLQESQKLKEMEDIPIEIIRSNRRTIAIEIKSDLRVIVRAPNRTSKKAIMKFVSEKNEWIRKHLIQMYSKKQALKNQEKQPKLTNEDINILAEKALKVIPERVEYFASIMGVSYGRITIRNQKTRWGSCSSKRNLNFNCLLMLTSPKVIDYVVVHELCHLKQMNHSKLFWEEVKKVMPDYEIHRKWLKENGGAIIDRMC